MDDEKRDAMQWKAQMRPITCAGITTDLDGANVSPTWKDNALRVNN
jgi:hypothetical protein